MTSERIPYDDVVAYVRGLKATGQFRKTYYYLVVAEDGVIIGHNASPSQNFLNRKGIEHIALGRAVGTCRGYAAA